MDEHSQGVMYTVFQSKCDARGMLRRKVKGFDPRLVAIQEKDLENQRLIRSTWLDCLRMIKRYEKESRKAQDKTKNVNLAPKNRHSKEFFFQKQICDLMQKVALMHRCLLKHIHKHEVGFSKQAKMIDNNISLNRFDGIRRVWV